MWLLIRLGVGAFLAMNIMLFSLLLYSGTFGPTDGGLVRAIHVLLWVFATPVLVILGGPFIRGAWQTARHGRATADTLISIGALAAYGYSALEVVRGGSAVYFDTVTMVLLLFTVGRYLEAVARSRAARSLRPMFAAEREQATVLVDGVEEQRPVRDVKPGIVVRVRPGERVPVDGVVVDGHSNCDEAVLTGEARPRPKSPGVSVFAGSINGMGQLLVRTTTTGTATRWGRISQLVRQSLERQSPLQRLVDKAAGVFVPVVLVLAGGTVWYWSGHGPFDQALMHGLAVLVVACPCALGLAAPLVTTLAISQVAGRGGVVRGGGVIEALAGIRGVAFDKTGTLTTGNVRMVGVVTEGVSEAELLQRAAALEQGSEHPLARGIVAAADVRKVVPETVPNVQARPGQGVVGGDGERLTAVGNTALMATLQWPIPPALAARARELEADAPRTAIYVGWAGRVRGLLLLDDTLRPEAGQVVTDIRELGLTTLLLSGDTPAMAESVAGALGFDAWQAALSPVGKSAALETWSQKQGPVAMVGDGLNDGPVLAAATVGVAVGGATDLARESADIVLPATGLVLLPWLVRLARRVRKIILSNLAWAFGYNVVALSLGAFGLLQPILAAGLMAGSSLVVVVNSLRLERLPGGVASAKPTVAVSYAR